MHRSPWLVALLAFVIGMGAGFGLMQLPGTSSPQNARSGLDADKSGRLSRGTWSLRGLDQVQAQVPSLSPQANSQNQP